MQYVHIGGKTMFLMLFGKNKILEREGGRKIFVFGSLVIIAWGSVV